MIHSHEQGEIMFLIILYSSFLLVSFQLKVIYGNDLEASRSTGLINGKDSYLLFIAMEDLMLDCIF